MLYSEFVEGTGCKETEHNFKVYKDLETLYANSDLTKAEIYEYGKKLVDNSKTAEEISFEAQMNEQIAFYTKLAADEKWKLERFQEWKKDPNRPKDEIEWIKNEIRACKRNHFKYRMKVSDLKWMLTHSV